MGVFTSNIFSNETKESVLSELSRLKRELAETQTRLQLYKNVSAELNSEMAVEAIIERTVLAIHKVFPALRITYSTVTAKLRAGEYDAVVIDQSLVDVHTASADTLWKHSGTAIPVIVNFAISGVDRIVRDVRSALARRRQEQLLAARAAQAALRNELAGAISGILLSSELALAQPAVPVGILEKLRSVHELALQIQSRLGTAV